MGCCMSSEESGVYEVVLNEHGVARRVPSGQGTHLIYVSKDTPTRMEQKEHPILPSSLSTLARPDPAYPKQPRMVPWNLKSKRTAVSPEWSEKNSSENK